MTMFREYEFQFNGINYVSSVDVQHPIYQRIKAMPAGAFEQMNISMISEIIKPTWTLAEISARLVELNEGGSYAFIQLGDN